MPAMNGSWRGQSTGARTPAEATRGSRRAHAVVLLLVTCFILYGSLFPFEYSPRHYPGGAALYLLGTWRQWDHRGDLLANILLYMPFGFFTACVLPRRLPALLRLMLPALLGAGLAACIEIAQFHDVGRVTSMGDVYANGIGAGLGTVAAMLAGPSLRWPLLGELVVNRRATLLLAMFFAYRLYPYVPDIDLHKYWHAVRPLLTAPSLPPGEFVRYLVTWLFVGAIVHALYGTRRFVIVFPLLCGAEFAGRVVIHGTVLKLDDVASAVIAWLAWLVVLRRLPGRYGGLALLFAVMIVAERLQPFRFAPTPRAFGWIPFASFLQGSTAIDIQSFCQKFYEYGGLIWLLTRAGTGLAGGTLLTACLLLVTSVAECWLPGRSAEITDALMAAILGIAFAALPEPVPGAAGPKAGTPRQSSPAFGTIED